MASIRRTLSLGARPGIVMNAEACQVASPSSKLPSNNQNYSLLSLSMGSLEYALCKARSFMLSDLLSPPSSRALDRSKVKGQIWRKAFLSFLICFVVGIFVGLTPFVSPNFSINIMSKHQALEVLQQFPNNHFYGGRVNRTSIEVVDRFSVNENSTIVPHQVNVHQGSTVEHHKLLIIVTPTYARPLQAYYLSRLANTLKQIPHPCLWIIVEMKSQSAEIADLLRKTGVMYRHLVYRKKLTEIKDRRVHLRNVALSHILKHRLDGIVHFADDDNIYSVDLFNQMGKIRRFGTWVVAKLAEGKRDTVFEGPICNGSQVIGWHTDDEIKGFRRFHADMSGFAFNSTILWDPKRWHPPTPGPIRQLDTMEEGFQASIFMEQIVEEESQMECISLDSKRIMVWHRNVDLHSYPQIRIIENGLSITVPIA